MKYICPLIVVDDIEASREFYVNILDQKVKADFGQNVTFEGDFAIHLKDHYEMLIGRNDIKKNSRNFELYFEHDELDGLFERLKEMGVEFVHDVMEQPWKQKVVRFYDPDGHIIEVGESMQHLVTRLHNKGHEPEEISQITSLPIEYVNTLV